MEHLALATLFYLAFGAACFAQPDGPAVAADFGWQRQWAIFRTTLPAVLAWPLTMWRLARS